MPFEMKVLKRRCSYYMKILNFFFFRKRKLNHLNMEQIPLVKVEYFEKKLLVFLPFSLRTQTNSWLTYVLVKTIPYIY